MFIIKKNKVLISPSSIKHFLQQNSLQEFPHGCRPSLNWLTHGSSPSWLLIHQWFHWWLKLCLLFFFAFFYSKSFILKVNAIRRMLKTICQYLGDNADWRDYLKCPWLLGWSVINHFLYFHSLMYSSPNQKNSWE